jgi:hypothetical protein
MFKGVQTGRQAIKALTHKVAKALRPAEAFIDYVLCRQCTAALPSDVKINSKALDACAAAVKIAFLSF